MAPNGGAMTRLIGQCTYSARLHNKKRKEQERQRKIRLVAALSCTVAAFMASLFLEAPEPIPMHTSILTGQRWLSELLDGHPDRLRDQLGLAKHVFFRLLFELQAYSGLVDTKYVTAMEKLGTFLHWVHTGSSSRMLQERFQRSAETIHISIYSILHRLVGPFYQKHSHLPPDETPYEIKSNPKLYPYFCNCRGAINSSHFHAWVLSAEMGRYWNRKGFIGQNVLAARNFAMLFCVYFEWLGGGVHQTPQSSSMPVSAILSFQRASTILQTPGSPCVMYSSLHTGVFGTISKNGALPKTPQELFNLRHSQARNVIERIFGIAKRRFAIFDATPEYPIETQAMLVPAVAAVALHNFIRIHDVTDEACDFGENTLHREGSGSLHNFTSEEP
ncbi:putative nuclease HARBI1-like protein [Mycena venus]|uniref:Putative nuclease HARBI1-like protein n=1 Tax=Mycena venus TaxID=2733690 RepID=A0A8H6Z7L6_9AGAR|nr:putative nuclease HARBI1-like protein [Mycena venus]